MKKGIHPECHKITVRCVCGNTIETTSTLNKIDTDICSACHPFFTGAQKFVDTAGRIEKFQRRYTTTAATTTKSTSTKPTKQATKAAATAVQETAPSKEVKATTPAKETKTATAKKTKKAK